VAQQKHPTNGKFLPKTITPAHPFKVIRVPTTGKKAG
jgi:hypothetical protein